MRKGDRYLGYIETELSLSYTTEPKVYRQTTHVKRSKSDLPANVLFVCLSLHVDQTAVNG